MNRDIPFYRRIPALLLLGSLPGLSATIPLLDFMVGDGGAAVEARHHPETHGFPHNHLICVQQQASQWAPTVGSHVPFSVSALSLPGQPDPTPSTPTARITLPHPRAPPSV